MPFEKIPLNKKYQFDIINVPGGITAEDIAKTYKYKYLINLALYDNDTKTNITLLEDENKVSGYLFSSNGIGIENRIKPLWCSYAEAKKDDSIFDYVSGSPILIQNGKIDIDWGNKYSSYVDKTHYRTAIGLSNNELILYASSGETTIKELATTMMNLGCLYAINCDGGGSCHFEANGKTIKRSGRKNVSWLMVREVEETDMSKRIMLDPGHGGKDPGAVGPTGLQEKEVVLKLSKLLGKELEHNGIIISYTRTTDERFSDNQGKDLSARANKANTSNVDFFISLHCNSYAETSKGIETCILATGGQAEKLAKSIQSELVKSSGLVDRGVKAENFAVLRETKMPAALIELGFISNPSEEKLLKDNAFLQKQAEAIALGVCNYIGIVYKKSTTQSNANAPSDWAKEPWQWAIDNKITDGTNPQGAVTREQLVSMLHRYDRLRG